MQQTFFAFFRDRSEELLCNHLITKDMSLTHDSIYGCSWSASNCEVHGISFILKEWASIHILMLVPLWSTLLSINESVAMARTTLSYADTFIDVKFPTKSFIFRGRVGLLWCMVCVSKDDDDDNIWCFWKAVGRISISSQKSRNI